MDPTNPSEMIDEGDAKATPRGGCRLFVIVFAAVLLALVVAGIGLKFWLFPKAFSPVSLRDDEKVVLNQKIMALGAKEPVFAVQGAEESELKPEPYSELGANRELQFSERELNALLAKNTDLARKLVIDLSQDLASAKLVLPVDPDFPVLGGQTIRASAGLEARFENGRPVVILRGVSVWGVPLPSAWMGNLKNVDVIAQYGEQGGFWQSLADGLDDFVIRDGALFLRLKP